MGRIVLIFRRLLYVSARQVFRRWRTYLSVFVTSLTLLALTMTALEMFESYYFKSAETASVGSYHLSFLNQLYDRSEDMRKAKNVVSVRTVASGARLASSVDASAPARVTSETEEIDRALGVRYLWGSPPGEGEIAVPLDLYRASDWITAGEVNDLWFTAEKMTYYPLRVSGVFTVSGSGSGYVFLSDRDRRQINRETGAVEVFDHYVTVSHPTPNMASSVAEEIFKTAKIVETDFQSRTERTAGIAGRTEGYTDYLNLAYLDMQVKHNATPVTLWVLPVVALAALILSSFMISWCRSHAEEFGVLAAMGATRWELCAVAAGQIFLISLLSALPVVPLSALLSNLYISAYNSAAAGEVGFLFVIPWRNLIVTAVRFVLFSALFTFFGIAAFTKNPPFPLISGTAVTETVGNRLEGRWLDRMKDRKKALALRMSLRRIRREFVPAAVNAIVCVTLGAFVLLFLSGGANGLFGRKPLADMVLSRMSGDGIKSVLPLTDAQADEIRSMPGVASVSVYTSFGGGGEEAEKDPDHPNRMLSSQPIACRLSDEGEPETMWCSRETGIADMGALALIASECAVGDPVSLFSDPCGVIAVIPNEKPDAYLEVPAAGDVFAFVPKASLNSRGTIIPPDDDEGIPYTVRAVMVCAKNQTLAGGYGEIVWIFSPEGGERLGLSPAIEHDTLLVHFDPSAPEEVVRNTVEEINSASNLIRYDIRNITVLTAAEKKIEEAGGMMLTIFLAGVFTVFCVTSAMHASIKASGTKKETAVLRQIGADGGDILRAAEAQTVPGVVLAFLFAAAVMLLSSALFLLIRMYLLNVWADSLHIPFTSRVYGKFRSEIFAFSGKIALAWLISLPFGLVTAAALRFSVHGPTKKILREPVTEGLRKDTD